MLQLAKELTCEKSIVLGFRDEEFLSEEFEPYGTVYKSSDNGTIGVKGTVMDADSRVRHRGHRDLCLRTRTPTLRAIQSYALEHGIEAQLSLEERMACGVGACLACVCKSKEIDDHSQVKNKRVCKDGPVFYAEEVELIMNTKVSIAGSGSSRIQSLLHPVHLASGMEMTTSSLDLNLLGAVTTKGRWQMFRGRGIRHRVWQKLMAA